MTDKTLTNESIGVYYWILKPKTTWVLGIVYAYPVGVIGTETISLDHPVEIEIVPASPLPPAYNVVSLFDIKEHLGITQSNTDDAYLSTLIDGISEAIEQYCRRKFAARRYTEYHSGDGSSGVLFVDEYPIVAVTSLHDDVDREFGSSDLIATGNYVVSGDDGMVELYDDETRFSKGTRNIKITYTGGYNTMPYSIGLAAMIWIDRIYKKKDRKNEGIESQNIGDKATTYRIDDIPPEVKMLLNPFKRLTLG